MSQTANPSARRPHYLGVPAADAPWLLYLGFLLLQPFFDPDAGPSAWLWIVVLIVLFVPIYGWTHRVIDARGWFWRNGVPGALLGIGAMILMLLLGAFVNPGSSAFAVYAVAAAAKLTPRRRALRVMGAAMLALVVAFFLSSLPILVRVVSFAPSFVVAPIIGLSVLFDRERRVANAHLKMAQEEVAQLAAIAERERIARDLHDLLGHTLSTITLKAELASNLLTRDPQRAEREMQDVERLSRQALAEVRGAVRGYRTTGLGGEIVNAKLALEAAGIEFDYYQSDLALKPAAEGVFALALREAVTNVVKHAGATRCRVTLDSDAAFVRLTVEDDGRGAASADVGVGSALGGSGVAAMTERARALGGYVSLEPSSAAGRSGTRLDVGVPVGTALRRVEEAS